MTINFKFRNRGDGSVLPSLCLVWELFFLTNYKISNVTDIARQVLEDDLKELEANGGDEARIIKPADIFKAMKNLLAISFR